MAPKTLRLRAEMKTGGRAWLQYEISAPEDAPKGAEQALVTQTATRIEANSYRWGERRERVQAFAAKKRYAHPYTSAGSKTCSPVSASSPSAPLPVYSRKKHERCPVWQAAPPFW